MRNLIRKDERAVSPVIATILMVAITVVLAAVLYVMVSGLLTGPGGGPQAIGIVVGRSSDATNWTLTVSSTPSGKALSSTTLVIKSGGGDIALPSAFLSTYTTETSGVKYVKVSGAATSIGVGDVVLMDTTLYPQGYRYEISDGTTLLASGELR